MQTHGRQDRGNTRWALIKQTWMIQNLRNPDKPKWVTRIKKQKQAATKRAETKCKQKQNTNQRKTAKNKNQKHNTGEDPGNDAGEKNRVASQGKTEWTDKDMRENKDFILTHSQGDQIQGEHGGKRTGEGKEQKNTWKRKNHTEGGTEKCDKVQHMRAKLHNKTGNENNKKTGPRQNANDYVTINGCNFLRKGQM